MPTAHVVVESAVQDSFRVAQIAGMFDTPIQQKQRREWNVSVPIEDREWRIGAIVGASGTGKTTIGKELFGAAAYHRGFKWSRTASVLDNFSTGMDTRDIVRMLSAVGFASPPAWMRPFGTLSRGEQFRVDLARVLLDDRPLAVVDEYTSVVNRQVAKIGSSAIAKTLRRTGTKQLVVISCHHDILEWLAPDWILDMDTVAFRWAQLHRPPIELEVYRCSRNLWTMFAPHHYLTAELHRSAKCYAGMIDGNVTAFVGVLPVMGLRNAYRASRQVVIPDYQGVGVMSAMGDAVGDRYVSRGKRYFLSTSHPAQIAALQRSERWVCRAVKRVGSSPHGGRYRGVATSRGRIQVSFEYSGDREPQERERIRQHGVAVAKRAHEARAITKTVSTSDLIGNIGEREALHRLDPQPDVEIGRVDAASSTAPSAPGAQRRRLRAAQNQVPVNRFEPQHYTQYIDGCEPGGGRKAETFVRSAAKYG